MAGNKRNKRKSVPGKEPAPAKSAGVGPANAARSRRTSSRLQRGPVRESRPLEFSDEEAEEDEPLEQAELVEEEEEEFACSQLVSYSQTTLSQDGQAMLGYIPTATVPETVAEGEESDEDEGSDAKGGGEASDEAADPDAVQLASCTAAQPDEVRLAPRTLAFVIEPPTCSAQRARF
jgi:hypothetical protein